jgi:hypothetical protein
MKTKLALAAIVLALTGCVVVPYERRPVQVTFETGVMYPIQQSEYFWDPMLRLYFFFGARNERRYMPRGWDYMTHGVPSHR